MVASFFRQSLLSNSTNRVDIFESLCKFPDGENDGHVEEEEEGEGNDSRGEQLGEVDVIENVVRIVAQSG